MKTRKKNFKYIIFIMFSFCVFHNYVSRNALLDMRYFLVFGHIWWLFNFSISVASLLLLLETPVNVCWLCV